MLTLSGIYQNGMVTLERQLPVKKSMRVIVTFIDDEFADYEKFVDNLLAIKKSPKQKKLDLNKFSFLKSMEATKEFDCSFSDSLLEERRLEE